MTMKEAIAAVLHEMDSQGIPTLKSGKFVSDWRFTEDAGIDFFDKAELVSDVECENNVDLPFAIDGITTVGELADLLVKAKA